MYAVRINYAFPSHEQMLHTLMDSIEESLPVEGRTFEYDGQLEHLIS
jgi:hypothetical protein